MSQPILLSLIVYKYNVLTMTAAFQVILEAEEDDNRPGLKNLECSETVIFALQLCFLLTCLHISISFEVGCIPQPPPPPLPQLSIALHVPIAHKRNMMMVAVFMISATPTAKAIQRQNLGFIRKTEIGCRLSLDPQTYQISELKNGNFYTIFVVKFVLFVCLFLCFISNKCVLNTSW